MTTILIRTIVIYIALIGMMRILGKRQIGELEATELVTTLIISEIATMPITDTDMPVLFALIPMATIMTIEILMSFVLVKIPWLRWLVSSHPSVVMKNGKIIQKELKKQRISIEELISEIRSAGYNNLSQINYAIVEENGTLTVIPKSTYRQPTLSDLGIESPEDGLMHIIVADGRIDKNGLSTIGRDENWLKKHLAKERTQMKDVYLMLSDDAQNITLIKKDRRRIPK
jgi:uncharacterized membrane protein YcaP (DUF421 family)